MHQLTFFNLAIFNILWELFQFLLDRTGFFIHLSNISYQLSLIRKSLIEVTKHFQKLPKENSFFKLQNYERRSIVALAYFLSGARARARRLFFGAAVALALAVL